MKNKIRALLLALGLIGGAVGLSAATSSGSASAWAWSPNVTLQGRVSCPAWGGPFDKPDAAYINGSTGDNVNVYLGSGGVTKSYTAYLTHVPISYEKIYFNWHCSATGWWSTSFLVFRPNFGTGATRNISP